MTLEDFTNLANECAYLECGHSSTCVMTSHALRYVLQTVGINAELFRVECGVFPEDRQYYGTVLGAAPETRRAAQSGMWKGHLVVIVDREWLLDPTLDQANKPDWPLAIRVRPAVVKLNEDFWTGRQWHRLAWIKFGTTSVRYSLYPKQNGFAHAPDARPSHWRPVADRMLQQTSCCAA